MNVLVDSTIWSLFLRRRQRDLSPAERALYDELSDLIAENRVVIIGTLRQELLSGIESAERFEAVRAALRDFPDEPTSSPDYERAAECYNTCRARGIQGSHADFLVCAVALRLDVPILTADRDFARYAQHLSIALHAPRSGSS